MFEILRHIGVALCAACLLSGAYGQDSLPPFHAVSLVGDPVTADTLIGKPGILIVTPGKGAAPDTRAWVETLRKDADLGKLPVYDALTISLPFFMTEKNAVEIARRKIPSQYYDQTWLLIDGQLEQGMNIPRDSDDSFVFLLDKEGRIRLKVQGKPTPQHIAEIKQALATLQQ